MKNAIDMVKYTENLHDEVREKTHDVSCSQEKSGVHVSSP